MFKLNEILRLLPWAITFVFSSFQSSRFPLNPTITPISLPKSNSTPSTSTNQAKIPDWQLEDIGKDSKDSKESKDSETNGDPILDSGSDDKLDDLDCKTELADKKETSNSDSEELNQSANSTETHENTFQSFQTLDDGESEAVKESKETKHAGDVIERIDKKGKKKYRVDPDLLIGYSRRTIIWNDKSYNC